MRVGLVTVVALAELLWSPGIPASVTLAPPSTRSHKDGVFLCSVSFWVRSGEEKDILSSWHLSSKQIAQRVPSVDILCTNRK